MRQTGILPVCLFFAVIFDKSYDIFPAIETQSLNF